MLACGRVPKSDDIDLEVHVEVGRSTEVSVNIGHRCVIRSFVRKSHLHIQYHTIQYSERFVRRRSTNRQERRIISQYARSNKTVLSRFLNALVSVMSCKSDGRVFQAAGPE